MMEDHTQPVSKRACLIAIGIYVIGVAVANGVSLLFWGDANRMFLVTLAADAIAALIVLAYCRKKGLTIYEKPQFGLKNVLLLVGFQIGIYFVSGFLSLFLDQTTTVNAQGLQALLDINKGAFVCMTVIYAPFTEEMVFRGVVLKNLFARHQVVGFFISSLIFSLLHLPTDLFSLLHYLMLGMLLAGMYFATGKSVTQSFFLHLCNNLISAVIVLAAA